VPGALPVRLRVSFALAALAVGCGHETPVMTAPRALPPLASAPPSAPPPLGSLPANAEDALLARLTAPLSLYVRTAGTDRQRCDALVLSAESSDRTRIRQNTTINPILELYGGSLQHSSLLTYFRLHGQSAQSLLMNGREWFFERQACLESEAESTTGLIDAARRFWEFDGELLAPIAEPGGAVVCRVMDVRRARRGSLAELRGSAMRTYNVTRAVTGMSVTPGFGPVRIGTEALLVVHGFDAEAFYISGSRWFKTAAACESSRPASKPVNFDPTGIEWEDADAFELESTYYRTDTVGEGRGCSEVKVAQLTPTVGRVMMREGGQLREWGFDFYPHAGALWLGPEHPASGTGDRFAGELRPLEREQRRLRVGGELWFEQAQDCERSAKSRKGGSTARAADSASR